MSVARGGPLIACHRCQHAWTGHLRPSVVGAGRRQRLVAGRCTRIECPCLGYVRRPWWRRVLRAGS